MIGQPHMGFDPKEPDWWRIIIIGFGLLTGVVGTVMFWALW